MLTVGSQASYQWLVYDEDLDLLELCPEIVIGKYVAVTSFDSGQLVPGDIESAAGWQSREKIAYSPKIEKTEDVPRDGWDEWYIFTTPTDLGAIRPAENIFEAPQEHGNVSVFVNYGFGLHPPDRAHLADLFWLQIARIRPESYVANNDFLTFVTMNEALFAKLRGALNALR